MYTNYGVYRVGNMVCLEKTPIFPYFESPLIFYDTTVFFRHKKIGENHIRMSTDYSSFVTHI